ncbi:MAG TPA: C40 family peptidase [Bryobacteraceae bacterium]|jgi:cell wall-associated NlpC family hydrolase|nr:C40 family peptidase [Bryobacteraceae bacterium]
MHLRRLIGLSGVLSYLAVPVSLLAQVAGGVEFYGALDNAAPVTRTIGGLALSVGTPFVGVRGSGGLGISSLTTQSTGINQGPSDMVWATNADLIFGPVNARLGEGMMPYAFGGFGLESSAQPSSFTDAIRTWSYGGGVQLALGRLLSINGEARSRHLAAPATVVDSQFVRGIEYRVGIGFHFGGSSRSRSSVYSRRTADIPPSAPRPSRTSRTTWPVSTTTSASGAARRVVPTAEQYIGVPYKYGGTSPRTGFDCSGFVQYVYGIQGVDLPRTSRQMAGAGIAVEPSTRSLVVGDLMLFQQGGRISHVAIYAGNGRFIHSSSSGSGVRYDDLGTRRGRWFAEHMVAARRVSGDGRIFGNAFAGGVAIAFDHLDPPDSAPPPSR